MATIFNKTKCDDCIHGQICVKKEDFDNLVEEINIVYINSNQHSAHVYIECDYFIKERDHYTPKHGGILLCEKSTKDN